MAQDYIQDSEFVIEAYTELSISPNTQISLTLDPIPTRLSANVQGGENITVKIFSDEDLVGEINNGIVNYSVEFQPGNVYVVVTGEPGDIFDITFSLD